MRKSKAQWKEKCEKKVMVKDVNHCKPNLVHLDSIPNDTYSINDSEQDM
jgi:hypothetical protein